MFGLEVSHPRLQLPTTRVPERQLLCIYLCDGEGVCRWLPESQGRTLQTGIELVCRGRYGRELDEGEKVNQHHM